MDADELIASLERIDADILEEKLAAGETVLYADVIPEVVPDVIPDAYYLDSWYDLLMPRDAVYGDEHHARWKEFEAKLVGKKCTWHNDEDYPIVLDNRGVLSLLMELPCRCGAESITLYLQSGCHTGAYCYGHDADGNYLVNLRDQDYVCDKCPRYSSATPTDTPATTDVTSTPQ